MKQTLAPQLGSTAYFSIAACAGYAAPYLREWIEFHRLIGAEKFFIYNANDKDAQREVLEPYVREGTVVLHEWNEEPPQIPSYRHCIPAHRDCSRWIAFLDTDEFLFSPAGRPVPEILREYEGFSGVGVCRAFFGPSGHRTRPKGLVIESYLDRLVLQGAEVQVKSIVDPKQVDESRVIDPHYFPYTDGYGIDEKKRPLDGCRAPSLSYEILRINHYWTRSEEEARAKFTRRRADTGEHWEEQRLKPDYVRQLQERRAERDEMILSYTPALRRAMGITGDSPTSQAAVS